MTSAGRLPPWVKVPLPGRGDFYQVRKRLRELQLNTVCEAARCPNMAECWGCGTATFMILGDVCTRGCRFCDVTSGKPSPPDVEEPANLAAAVQAMKLRYVVITSVDRDDLPDQGSLHFVVVVQAIKATCPEVIVELLTPDFRDDATAIEAVGQSGAEVLGHNIETTRLLTRGVRDIRCSYDQSLRVLERFRALGSTHLVKSSLMLGLGEAPQDVLQTLGDLRSVGVDWVTLGQYLRPTRKHLEVARFVSPEEFDELAVEARAMGFPLVTAGPLVRSSYRAAEKGAQQLLRQRAFSTR
ncbi:MAG: lipoyl synthase [Deltaproteobacteria bacterium]|nr:lipoyl synthase [Deltaproteobacteria bacterium]